MAIVLVVAVTVALAGADQAQLRAGVGPAEVAFALIGAADPEKS